MVHQYQLMAVILMGAFYSISDIVIAMQQQHPVTSYNSTTHELTISNTTQIYNTMSFSCGQKLIFQKCRVTIPERKVKLITKTIFLICRKTIHSL